MMIRETRWFCSASLTIFLLVACSPALPEENTTPTETMTLQEPGPTSTTEIVTETPPEQPATHTPEATPTEWEQVQQVVGAYRNRLERGSDGYAGLSEALEQNEPNETWCSGLAAAIGDFNYANEVESAQALAQLRDSQACP